MITLFLCVTLLIFVLRAIEAEKKKYWLQVTFDLAMVAWNLLAISYLNK
jgi:hypothetical protein